MPRTTTVEAPGCPPLRVLTFDSLGLIKVVEAHGNQKQPQVVDRWGAPDSSRYVLAASIADHRTRPLLAVARKNGLVELVNSLNGDIYVAMELIEADTTGHILEDNLVSGLHLFKRDLPRESALVACTVKGIASLRSIKASETSVDFTCSEAPTIWNVCAAGKILCSSIDGNEKYAVFGGKGVEVRVWDLEKVTQFWTAKHPPSNSNGLFTPTWFTATTFLSKDDHRKIVAGTNNHQVRLYDISAQRRPVISFHFRESPIKVVTEDLDGHTVYVGNGCGDLASFDMRTGKLLGCFVGKCSGSIRSIVRHPEYPLIASCGLDSWLRFWDTKTRKPLAGVFLKQHLNSLVIDANFKDEGTSGTTEQPKELQMSDHTGDEDYTDLPPLKRKKSSKSLKKDQTKKVKTSKQVLQEADHIQVEGDDKSDGESESLSLKRRKAKSKNKNQHKKVRSESESSESEGNNELRQHMKSKERDQHKKVKLKHKESDGTLLEEDIDSEGEDEPVHTKHKKLPKSKSRDQEVKSKTRNDVPEKSDDTDAGGDDKSEVDDGSLRPKRKKLSKSEVRGQRKAKSNSSKKRTQDDSDNSDDDEL